MGRASVIIFVFTALQTAAGYRLARCAAAALIAGASIIHAQHRASRLVAGCSTCHAAPYPYKMDIQQGNVVTQDMIAKLQPGMTRSQVRFALGTPLVVDPFRNDRWDYVYRYMKAGELTEQRRLTVIFKDDKLVRIEGDVVPAT